MPVWEAFWATLQSSTTNSASPEHFRGRVIFSESAAAIQTARIYSYCWTSGQVTVAVAGSGRGSLVGPTGQLPHLNPRPRPRTIPADRRRPEASRGASLAVPFGVPTLSAACALSPCFREEGFRVTRYRAGSIRCACRSGGYSCRASDLLQILERPCAKACRAATQWARGPVGRSIWPPRCRPSGRIDPGARYDPQSNDPPDCGGRRRTRCRTDRTEPEQKIPPPEHGAGDLGVGADSLPAVMGGRAKRLP